MEKKIDQVEFHHIHREWNGAADTLATMALQKKVSGRIQDDSILQLLLKKNRLPILLQPTKNVPSILTFKCGPNQQLAALRLDRIS